MAKPFSLYSGTTRQAFKNSPPLTYIGFTGSFASFQTGDPNAHKFTNSSVPGVSESWSTGEEFVVLDRCFENISVGELDARCSFWRGVAGGVPV